MYRFRSAKILHLSTHRLRDKRRLHLASSWDKVTSAINESSVELITYAIRAACIFSSSSFRKLACSAGFTMLIDLMRSSCFVKICTSRSSRSAKYVPYVCLMRQARPRAYLTAHAPQNIVCVLIFSILTLYRMYQYRNRMYRYWNMM